MLVRMMLETEVDPMDVPVLQEYLNTKRRMMLDPGGDAKSYAGRFVGCVNVYGDETLVIAEPSI